MRRFFLLAAGIGLLYVATGCDSQTAATANDTTTPDEQKNLAASRTISKAFETGDVAMIDSVVADDFLDHTDRGDMKGKDSLKSMIKWIKENMKDAKMETVREVADGDYVWSWMRYTGTSDGSMGMPKGPYDMQAVELAKFRDGKAVEHWNFMEAQDVMAMMAPPNMDPNKMPADTSKMKK